MSGRRSQGEKNRADRLLGGFRADESRGLAFLERIIPDGSLTEPSLIVLGQIMASVCKLDFPRDFKRRRGLLIKWFDNNVDKLEPLEHVIRVAMQRSLHGHKNAEDSPSTSLINSEDDADPEHGKFDCDYL
jgi:hypothetical protein